MRVQGAKVAVTDVLEKEGKILAEEIYHSGSVAKLWHLDVSDEQEVKKVYASVVTEYERLDAPVIMQVLQVPTSLLAS